jgi:hypothetical protein
MEAEIHIGITNYKTYAQSKNYNCVILCRYRHCDLAN